jgi:hypothetical protein
VAFKPRVPIASFCAIAIASVPALRSYENLRQLRYAFSDIRLSSFGVAVAALALPVTFIRPLAWRRAFATSGKDGSRLRARACRALPSQA